MFRVLASLLITLLSPAQAQSPDPKDWDAVLAEARGQRVFWNAWGGDEGINAHIAWVADQVAARYDIDLRHVKIPDTAAAIQVVETEFAAGRTLAGGSIDLIWLNGENFARLKRQGMLGDPFSEDLPNYGRTDFERRITIRQDFSEPVDGLESPWGLAQFTILFDSARMADFPGTAEGLLAWAQAHPGRLAYPAPPSFLGTTFLKQIALETLADPDILYAPAVPDSAEILAPLWTYLDALHPLLWRQGQAFPDSSVALRTLFQRDEIDAILTFNPGDATALVAQGLLPASIAAQGFARGSIGNTHFVAIPGNSGARAAALVVANFLLSPEAQGHKAQPQIWGDATVLNLDRLTPEERALFPDTTAALGPSVLEPHASWVAVLEAAWADRYAR